ncbi:hypothetical protein [Streptomyces sp. NBC_01268]|uniref:hypothetical protein n=1 Tax=Streptomyces sp. NBC_01268 TaxID=2903806 RepID=UPI002E3769DA|nr:hypothetical protein [Streptomyces sp. NBC_01268]
MTEIPTTPCNDPAETIMAAVAHGMDGNPALGLTLLGPFIEGGPTTTVSMCAALASMVGVAAEKQNPGARGTFGLLAFHGDVLADTRSMAPGLRFAAQFTAAWLNGQSQTAYALFDALVVQERDEDARNLAEGIHALYDMAVSSAQQMRGGAS